MKFLFFLIPFLSFVALGQVVPENGVAPSKPSYYILKNAEVIISPDKKLPIASILIKDNKIVEVGPIVFKPKDAVEIDCKGKVIVPGFIDLNSSIGMPDVKPTSSGYPYRPQMESAKKGAYYWNESIHPEVNACENYHSDSKASEALNAMGYTFALSHINDGIAQGTGAVVALGNGIDNEQLVVPVGSSHYSFSKGISRQSYPSSQMGAIALIRQSFYDFLWYEHAKDKSTDLSMEAYAKQKQLPAFFEVSEGLEIFRAQKIASEFNRNFTYYGAGDEYMYLDQLKDINASIVLPINFPKAFDVSNPYINRLIPLEDLKHWELAPSNPYILASRGLRIALSSTGHKSAKDFWEHIHEAMARGLSEEDALRALTTNPAEMIQQSNLLGTIEKGKLASFTIYSDNPFKGKATLLEVWNIGKQTVLSDLPNMEALGGYTLNVNNQIYSLDLSCKGGKSQGKLTYKYDSIVPKTNQKIKKEGSTKVNVSIEGLDINLAFQLSEGEEQGHYQLHGKIHERFGAIEGAGTIPSGKWVTWNAIRKDKYKPENKDKSEIVVDSSAINNIWRPNMAYGSNEINDVKTIIIKNATVWTNETEGILQNATVIVKNGKIDFVGTGGYATPNGATVIDAEGKVLTSGIIDEHSHIAISKGVNEGGQAISAEVSIGDVVRPNDINIYRQLAGGVTSAQLLHGSANPIGGQSALIKLKWGYAADSMLIPNAPKFIKCALGENVKQSNWGDFNTVRFPQTRMGVEQVFYDAFNRARAYEAEWKAYNTGGKIGPAPRRDLELDALVEILNKERYITCHSYIQSEINMLMHVADSMGFTLNTFTHILEGYKVADKMAAHGAGGSTFADWWAYKYEVKDAIPYNAKIMADQGVIVAINSDDAEMGRRLNQEAAKAVKYGGMSEAEAWKMVTLNPAKLLHLDDRMGSIKVGKDADLVLWTDNPLSIYAIVDKTIVDGEILYDRWKNGDLELQIEAERARLIALMNEDKSPSKKKFEAKTQKHFHCNTLGEEGSTHENAH